MSTIRICPSGKRTFLSARDAWQRLCELRRLERKDKADKKWPNRVYECPECGGWHLTSSRTRDK